jgi:hypothetical protein
MSIYTKLVLLVPARFALFRSVFRLAHNARCRRADGAMASRSILKLQCDIHRPAAVFGLTPLPTATGDDFTLWKCLRALCEGKTRLAF